MTGSTAGSLATAAVVVSCNGRTLLEEHLPSLEQQTIPFRRILVVDNGSTDGSRQFIEARSRADLLSLETNHGFAAANNRGIEILLADPTVNTIATINNDVRLKATWHHEALSALATKPQQPSTRPVGSVATTMLQARRPELIDSAGIEWAADGRANNRGHGSRHRPNQQSSMTEVWGASAAACLYTRDFLQTVGGFNESFFAYQEDVELSQRGRRAGFRCLLANGAVGWHVGHATNARRRLGGTRADFLNARNRLAVMRAAHRDGQPAGPMLRSIAFDLLRSIQARNAPAVWHGIAQGVVRAALQPPSRTELQLGPQGPSPRPVHRTASQ